MYKCIAYFLCSCFSVILIEVPAYETEIQKYYLYFIRFTVKFHVVLTLTHIIKSVVT